MPDDLKFGYHNGYIYIYVSIYLSIQYSNSNQIVGPCGLLGSKRAAKFCEPLKRSAVSAIFCGFEGITQAKPCKLRIRHRLQAFADI